MNKFFVKNKTVAFSIDSNAKQATKTTWQCCCQCGTPISTQQGWIISSDKSKSDFKKSGIMVSRYW